MKRQLPLGRVLLVMMLLATLLGVGAAGSSAATGQGHALVAAPVRAERDGAFAVSVSLPRGIAAVDGRLLLDKSAAEVVGLAPVGGGAMLPPVSVPGGYAFGAYDLRQGGAALRLIVVPLLPGRLELKLVIDAAAGPTGQRMTLAARNARLLVRVDGGSTFWRAPSSHAATRPPHAPGALRDLFADGRTSALDLDVVRSDWEIGRAASGACASTPQVADANSDGCVDIVDVQLVAALQGRQTAVAGGSPERPGTIARRRAVAAGTFVVTSTADTPDAKNGDGKCADANGRCTLRAAVTEANWQQGPNRIEFNIASGAPAVISLGSSGSGPLIQDRSGGLTIDGYSQPGSRVNTRTYGSNAIPGVVIRGRGNSPQGWGLRITSSDNVIRGLSFNTLWRPIVIDGADAHDNVIVGNMFGFMPSGGLAKYAQYAGVVLNSGAHHNLIGRPALADRNVSGAGTKSFYLFGPGTDFNVIQNNQMCLTPNGTSTAMCSTAIDMNFGPKSNLVGGSGAGERNVIGPTRLNGIEISHGWDPDGVPDPDGKWLLSDNRVIGNWVGFRGDGSYHPDFRSGQRLNVNDSNGIDVIDGSVNNLIEGNWIGTVWDGINIMDSHSNGNVVRANVIGESPLGQPAPFNRYGINVRRGAQNIVIERNIIKNAGTYGIALTQSEVMFVRLSQNIISNMSGAAIYLKPASDGSGANGLLAPPVVRKATRTRAQGTGLPGATVEVYRASRAADQSGLPVAYLGSGQVGSDGKWSIAITVGRTARVTALQIAPDDNTSTLAVNVPVGRDESPVPESYVSDTFARTVSEGWGSAEVGGAYTTTGPGTDYGVNGSAATMRLPSASSSRSALLYGVSQRDVDILFSVGLDKVPSGGSLTVYATARRTSQGEYRPRVVFNANGSVTISASRVANGLEMALGTPVTVNGLTQAPGKALWFRAQVSGANPTTIRVKVWAAGATEPSSWQYTVTDTEAALQGPGSVGLRLWLAGSTSNAPLIVTFDDYRVRPT